MIAELGMSWTEVWLTVITATAIYFGVIEEVVGRERLGAVEGEAEQ